MDSLAQSSLLLLAGFVLSPALIGVLIWRRRESRSMWIATGVWAVAVAALAVTTVALSNTSLTTEQLGQLVTLRHMLFGLPCSQSSGSCRRFPGIGLGC